MFCPKCGAPIAEGATSCEYCNTAIPQSAPQQPAYQQQQQPTYQQPQVVYQQVVYQQPQQPQEKAQPMAWFKFLIYFGLFFGAFMNFGAGINLMNGNVYGDDANLVYRTFDGLETLDVLMGLLTIALAGFGIFVRFRLSGYRKNGPTMLNALYIGAAAVQVIYVIGILMVLPERALEYIDFSSSFGSIVISIIMVAANSTYFGKRKHLFVND